MIDDGEALTFQQCAPGFFPVFLHGFLRISPLPLAHSEGAVLELETVARLLEEDGGVESNCGAAGDDERLATSSERRRPCVARRHGRRLAALVADSRESSRRPPKREQGLRRACNPHGSLGVPPSTADASIAALMPLRSSTI